MDSATAFRSRGLPSSFCIDVTGFAVMPQGMIRLKKLRSVFTLRAKPCEVTKREMWMPIAASLASEEAFEVVPANSRFLDSRERFCESFSSARNDKFGEGPLWTSVQTPVKPGTRFAGIAKSSQVRIRTSSRRRTKSTAPRLFRRADEAFAAPRENPRRSKMG